jgi:hypothetical protein
MDDAFVAGVHLIYKYICQYVSIEVHNYVYLFFMSVLSTYVSIYSALPTSICDYIDMTKTYPFFRNLLHLREAL